MVTGKTFKKFKIEFILLLIILCGSYLRLSQLDKFPLWQDEAETAFYAKMLLKGEKPSAYDGKNFLYVGKFMPFAKDTDTGVLDSEMYSYRQADFDNYGRILYHPWGDFVVAALSFLLFGISTSSARLPFALAGVGSILFLYLMGSFIYNKRVGLFAAALLSLNYIIIPYERQVRHYPLSVFFTLACFYFFFRAFRSNHTKDYSLGTLFFVLLFYTMPIYSVSAVPVLLLSKIFFDKEKIFSKKIVICALSFFLFILPYLYFYRFWEYPIRRSITIHFILDRLSYTFGSAVIPFIKSIGFAIVFLSVAHLIYSLRKKDLVISTALFSFIFFIAILRPDAAGLMRTCLIFIPLICLICAVGLEGIYSRISKHVKIWPKITIALILLLMMLTPILFDNPMDFIDKIKAKRFQSLSPIYSYSKSMNLPEIGWQWISNWIPEVIDFLKSKEAKDYEKMFATYHQPAFIFYSNYTVFNVFSVKKSYLESTREKFWIIVGPNDYRASPCSWFLERVDKSPCNERHYSERIKSCTKHDMKSGAIIYECNTQ